MKYLNVIFSFLVGLTFLNGQVIEKPIGCYAGTNGTHPNVLSHEEARGVLITEKWSNIELSPGIFSFAILDNKINIVKEAGLKYSLAISTGAFGCPEWLIDSLEVEHHEFQYQNQTWRLPLWWDSVTEQKMHGLIIELGSRYADDPFLSHVYVSQMTVNGIEGHLNGINISSFTNDGFTSQKWITSAKSTTHAFADAFPNKPIVFEIHEIDNDTIIPSTIINELSEDPSLCERLGLGMWWISGKTTYQSDLLEYINNYKGDKYAQIIGRSDQVHRFKDSLYSTVFTQAKSLNIRYIEPWPYEFQHHTHDDLIHDFNQWADSNFAPTDTCSNFPNEVDDQILDEDITIYPNPNYGLLNIDINLDFKNSIIKVYTLQGQNISTKENQSVIDISYLPKGVFIIEINIDNKVVRKKLFKL